jgi:hypothetical protein
MAGESAGIPGQTFGNAPELNFAIGGESARSFRRIPADLPVRRRAVPRFPYHVAYLHVRGQIPRSLRA